MKLVRNLLLIAALVLGFVFIKQRYFSKNVEEATQTEQTAETPAEENAAPVAEAPAETPAEATETPAQ